MNSQRVRIEKLEDSFGSLASQLSVEPKANPEIESKLVSGGQVRIFGLSDDKFNGQPGKLTQHIDSSKRWGAQLGPRWSSKCIAVSEKSLENIYTRERYEVIESSLIEEESDDEPTAQEFLERTMTDCRLTKEEAFACLEPDQRHEILQHEPNIMRESVENSTSSNSKPNYSNLHPDQTFQDNELSTFYLSPPDGLPTNSLDTIVKVVDHDR